MTSDSQRDRLYKVTRLLKLYKHALQPLLEPEHWSDTPIVEVVKLMRRRAYLAQRTERMPFGKMRAKS